MKRFIPTFEQAKIITEKNECFTHRVREFNNVKISVFDYLLASYNDFVKPSEELPEYTAFELRGLCFTHNEDGSVHKRYLMLDKFFNLNQCPQYQLEDVKHKTIRKIMDKMDGSVMRFIKLPNGEVVAKSKTFFDNDQTKMAMAYYNSKEDFRKFINESLDKNIAVILEIVSRLNRIVVQYQETKLVVIEMRDEETGQYLDVHNHELIKKYNVEIVEDETAKYVQQGDSTLDVFNKLFEQKATLVNKEGWIIEFTDGQLLKLKCDEYCRLHGILTDGFSKENIFMIMIVDNTIDDALAELAIDDPRREVVEKITTAFSHYLSRKVKEVISFVKETYKGDKKQWCLEYRQHPLFNYSAMILEMKDEVAQEERVLKQYLHNIRKDVYYLAKARKFIVEELKAPLLLQMDFEEDA